MDLIGFQPKVANKALDNAHTAAGSFWFNFHWGFMLLSLAWLSKDVALSDGFKTIHMGVLGLDFKGGYKAQMHMCSVVLLFGWLLK